MNRKLCRSIPTKKRLRLKRNVSHAYERIRYILPNRIRVLERNHQLMNQYACSDDRPTFTHVTLYDRQNVGDTVLSECIRLFFRQQFKNASFSIKSVFQSTTAEEINKSSALLIGGHGLIGRNDQGEISFDWLFTDRELDRIKVPLVIFTSGYSTFHKETKEHVDPRHLIEKADFIGLRTKGAVRMLREVCLREQEEKIVFQPCLTTIMGRLLQVHGEHVHNNVAVNVPGRVNNDRQVRQYSQLAKVLARIHDKGYQIHFVMHGPGDRDFIPYLKRAQVPYELHDLSVADIEKTVSVYGQMKLVLGCRAHGCMIPFGLECQVIPLCVSDKLLWVAEALGLDDICVHMQSEQAGQDILTQFERSICEEKEWIQQMTRKQDEFMAITQDNIKKIRMLLGAKASESIGGGHFIT